MGLTELAKQIHKNNKEKGFHKRHIEVGTLIALMHSELSEALEAHRKNRSADLTQFDFERQGTPFHEKSITAMAFEDNIKDTIEDEMADTIIRILDFCGLHDIDIQRHLTLKLAYNESRAEKHGKQY